MSIGAGATIVAAPKVQPWGQVEARIRDPDGVLTAVIAPPPARK